MALLITCDGREEQVAPINGNDYQLRELQGFVNGYIEVLRLDNNTLIVVNEEGAVNGMDLNVNAMRLINARYNINFCLFGNVLICNDNEIK